MADATTRYVTTTDDSGPGSLREAITRANGGAGGTILLSNLTGQIGLQSQLPPITKNVSIIGPGSDRLTISGSNSNRVFFFNSGTTNLLSGLTIANGGVIHEHGGAVYNLGDLTLDRCLLISNVTATGRGGAIYSSGGLRILNSTFSGNLSGLLTGDTFTNTGYGGALYITDSTLTTESCRFYGNASIGIGGTAYGGAVYCARSLTRFRGCDFSGNTARGKYGQSAFGGAFYLEAGTTTMLESLIRNNQASAGVSLLRYDSHGGGLYVHGGYLTLTNCTLEGNFALGSIYPPLPPPSSPGSGGNGIGAGVAISNSTVTFANTTIAWNGASGGGGIATLSGPAPVLHSTLLASNRAQFGPDLFGSVQSHGYNLVSRSEGANGFAASDLLDVNPRLDHLLKDNGGHTFTLALLAGSPAIDRGVSGGLTTDQRGQPRTVDNPSVPNPPGGDGTDIGALEVDHRLRMTGIRMVDTNTLVSFTSVSDKTYKIQYNYDLNDQTWVSLQQLRGSGGIVTITNASEGPARFYRVSEAPQ